MENIEKEWIFYNAMTMDSSRLMIVTAVTERSRQKYQNTEERVTANDKTVH